MRRVSGAVIGLRVPVELVAHLFYNGVGGSYEFLSQVVAGE